MRLSHIALWTEDIEESARFWSDYFGAHIGARYQSLNRPSFASRFITLPKSNLQIEIMEGPWVEPRTGEVAGWAHIAFSVGSRDMVDQLALRFQQDGLLLSIPRQTGDGYYEAVVQAPDGTIIEIVE